MVNVPTPVLLPQPEAPRMVDRLLADLNFIFPVVVGYEPVTPTTGAMKTTPAVGVVVLSTQLATEIDDAEMLVGTHVMPPPNTE
jgi:hypothetical protein